jgi:hypothetical protein
MWQDDIAMQEELAELRCQHSGCGSGVVFPQQIVRGADEQVPADILRCVWH